MLGESLALNFVVSMDDSSTMEPRQKGDTKTVIVIQVIQSPPSSPPPSKPLDLSLHKVANGFIVDFPWRDTKEAHPVSVNDLVLKDEKEEGEVLEFYQVCPTFYIMGQAQMGCRNVIHKREENWIICQPNSLEFNWQIPGLWQESTTMLSGKEDEDHGDEDEPWDPASTIPTRNLKFKLGGKIYTAKLGCMCS